MKRRNDVLCMFAGGFSSVTGILALYLLIHLFYLFVLHVIGDTRFARRTQYAFRNTFTVVFPS